MLVVDAVVDDGDLHALAASASHRRELRSSDHERPAVHGHRVREVRVHVLRDVELEQLRQLLVREVHGESVQQQPVPTRDLRCGKRGADLGDGRPLGDVQLGNVRT